MYYDLHQGEPGAREFEVCGQQFKRLHDERLGHPKLHQIALFQPMTTTQTHVA
jgi:hypothetical protein